MEKRGYEKRRKGVDWNGAETEKQRDERIRNGLAER